MKYSNLLYEWFLSIRGIYIMYQLLDHFLLFFFFCRTLRVFMSLMPIFNEV